MPQWQDSPRSLDIWFLSLPLPSFYIEYWFLFLVMMTCWMESRLCHPSQVYYCRHKLESSFQDKIKITENILLTQSWLQWVKCLFTILMISKQFLIENNLVFVEDNYHIQGWKVLSLPEYCLSSNTSNSLAEWCSQPMQCWPSTGRQYEPRLAKTDTNL